jgi:hypothetical protein
MKKLYTLFILFISSTCLANDKEFFITNYEAVADGITINTQAIQTAINQAGIKGGKVIVPEGRFVTGPISLLSNVELHVVKGGFLLGSINRLDYGVPKAKPLISAHNQQNISITGEGEIDGRGYEMVQNLIQLLEQGVLQDSEWKTKRPGGINRCTLIDIVQCKNVLLKHITIKNSSSWVQDINRCDGVVIDSIKVESNAYWNNDGIDIVNSKNVTISNSFINSADDAIVLKSEAGEGWCENIVVTNCKLRSSANAFKLGTGSEGGFRNITVRNLEVYDTYRSAIALEAVDGGFLENIDIQNVNAVNTGNAIFIRLGHRNKDNKYSTVQNIRIANVKVQVPSGKPDKGYPMEGPLLKYPSGTKPALDGSMITKSISPWNHSGKESDVELYHHNVFPSSITGLPGQPVKNVVLENIEIIYEGGADKNKVWYPLDSLAKITEATASYPEFSMFGELPCWGLYARHLDGLTMKNIKMTVTGTEFRSAAIFDDVKRLSIDKIVIPSNFGSPIMVLNNVESPRIKKTTFKVSKQNAIKTTSLK